MKKVEFNTPRFSNTDEQASEVRAWRGHYSNVVQGLGKLGTEVRVRRILESDRDIAPYSFVRDAVHEFVFPPQEVPVTEDNSKIIDPTPGYELRLENVTRDYDQTKVRGRLQVRYDDADSMIHFEISDQLEESELAEDVLAAIAVVEIPATSGSATKR